MLHGPTVVRRRPSTRCRGGRPLRTRFSPRLPAGAVVLSRGAWRHAPRRRSASGQRQREAMGERTARLWQQAQYSTRLKTSHAPSPWALLLPPAHCTASMETLGMYSAFHIPLNYVVERVPAQRNPPEVRIWRFRNQSCVGTLPPSTSTPHCPACCARR